MTWGIYELGLTQKQKDNYSFQRVMSAIANRESPNAQKAAGFELDLSHQICKRDNRETPGAIIPQEVLDNPYRSKRPVGGPIMTDQVLFGSRKLHPGTRYGKRAMVAGTDTQGGHLVDDQLRSLIAVLVENTLALQNVPAYTVTGDTVDFPGQDSKVTPTWKAETGTADEDNPTFTQVSFTMKRLTVKSHVSRTVLIQANPDLEAFVRNDIAIGIAKEVDTAMFYGLGTDTSLDPTGVKATTGIESVTWTAANVYKNILTLWSDIGVNNIPTRNLKWFGSWRFAHDCKRAQKMHDYSEMPVIGKDGMIDGVPVEVTSQIVGTTALKQEAFMADWNEAALVLWQDLEIEVDPYTLLDTNQVRFVGQMLLDFNVLRPGAFGRIGGA